MDINASLYPNTSDVSKEVDDIKVILNGILGKFKALTTKLSGSSSAMDLKASLHPNTSDVSKEVNDIKVILNVILGEFNALTTKLSGSSSAKNPVASKSKTRENGTFDLDDFSELLSEVVAEKQKDIRASYREEKRIEPESEKASIDKCLPPVPPTNEEEQIKPESELPIHEKEQRIEPESARTYPWSEFGRTHSRTYSEEEVVDYWSNSCKLMQPTIEEEQRMESGTLAPMASPSVPEDLKEEKDVAANLISEKTKRKLKLNTSDPADPDIPVPTVTTSTPRKKQLASFAQSSSDATDPFLTTPQSNVADWREGALNTTPEATSLPSAASAAQLAPPPEATHYQVLNVAYKASDADIRKAYRQAAVRWHPDKNVGREGDAADTFRRVREAFDVLTDREKRCAYDISLASGASDVKCTPVAASDGSCTPRNAESIPCDSQTINARIEGRIFYCDRSRQIKGNKRKPHGLTLFYDDVQQLKMVSTFGLSNNVRFAAHEVVEVGRSIERTAFTIKSRQMHIELVLSCMDPGEVEILLKHFPS